MADALADQFWQLPGISRYVSLGANEGTGRQQLTVDLTVLLRHLPSLFLRSPTQDSSTVHDSTTSGRSSGSSHLNYGD